MKKQKKSLKKSVTKTNGLVKKFLSENKDIAKALEVFQLTYSQYVESTNNAIKLTPSNGTKYSSINGLKV